MPVIVQPRLVVMVLPLEAQRVRDGCRLARRFTDRLLRDTPRTIFRTPRNLALFVRQLLRRAEVVALVPRQAVDGRRWRRRQPQRVFVLPVVVAVLRLVEQKDGILPHRLYYRNEAARLVYVVRGARTKAILVGDPAFPRHCVAVPPVQREAALQFAVALDALGAISVRPCFSAFLVVGLAVLGQAPAEGVVAVVRLQALVFVVSEAVEQVPGVAAFLAVMPALAQVASRVVLVVGAGVLLGTSWPAAS